MEISIEETLALRAYVMGDAFDVAHIDTFLARADAVAMEAENDDDEES